MATSADVFKMAMVYTAGGQYMESILHFLSSATNSTTPQADALALCSQFSGVAQTSLLNCWYSDVTLLGWRAARINNGGGPSAVLPAAAGTIGTYGTGPGMPTSRQCALIENDYYYAAGTPPRWRQGRIYMGGVPGAFWSNDQWTSAAITNYLAFMAYLNTSIGTTPLFNYGTWSKKNSTIYSGGDQELSAFMGYQKRRTRPSL